MSTTQSKSDLRQRILGARRQIDMAGKTADLTQNIQLLIRELGAQKVASYLPIAGEPDLEQINKNLSDRGGLVLPAVEGDGITWRVPGALVPGPFGTRSPSGGAVNLESVDLVLLPALAIDSNGYRLGRGGGYYDRALAEYRPDSKSVQRGPRLVAVVFERELVAELPREQHDVRVDGVVTETGYLWFT